MTDFQDVYIRSNVVNDTQKQLNDEAHVVSTAFTSHLEIFKTSKIWRFTVSITDKPELDGYIEDLKEVLTIYMLFDYSAYWSLDGLERKKVLLNTLYNGILILSERAGIEKSYFDNAYIKSIENGIKLATYWGEPSNSVNEKLEARIWLEFDLEVSKIEAHVKEISSGNTIKELLIEPKRRYSFFDKYLGKVYWETDKEFCLCSKKGDNILKFTVPSPF